MIQFMITAPSSNTGKTAVTCGLLSLLERKGLRPCAFKCGPDYIDPMFHRSVMGIQSNNLDIFLAGEDGVKKVFHTYSKGHDAAVCEGVMGYYDGRSSASTEASAWHVASLLEIPAILVVRPKGSALTLAAIIKGMCEFRTPSRICGVIFNDCSEMFYKTYGPAIEKESGVPVLGYLPHMEEAGFESRHLGLMTAEEIDGLAERIACIGCKLEETLDLDRLVQVTSQQDGPPAGADCSATCADVSATVADGSDHAGISADEPVTIAVARDAAFNFIYDESLSALEKAGAKIEFFSPLRDAQVPENACGLYLPGGYPELYGKELSENRSMLASIRSAVKGGMPTVAECGGFLYLSQKLADADGKSWDMAGALPGEAANTGKLVRFGYGYISTDEDSLLFRKGDAVPIHEFHYWDTTDAGSDLHLTKASNGKEWDFGFAGSNLYAGFPHLYFAGNDGLLAKRFAEAAKKYKTTFTDDRNED